MIHSFTSILRVPEIVTTDIVIFCPDRAVKGLGGNNEIFFNSLQVKGFYILRGGGFPVFGGGQVRIPVNLTSDSVRT